MRQTAREETPIELPSWLAVLDEAVDAIERTAWDLRGVACAAADQATGL